jgi:hypothetical protein
MLPSNKRSHSQARHSSTRATTSNSQGFLSKKNPNQSKDSRSRNNNHYHNVENQADPNRTNARRIYTNQRNYPLPRDGRLP